MRREAGTTCQQTRDRSVRDYQSKISLEADTTDLTDAAYVVFGFSRTINEELFNRNFRRGEQRKRRDILHDESANVNVIPSAI